MATLSLETVMGILAHRDAAQRRQIKLAYEERFKEDLIKRLESELSGDFEKAVYMWMFEPLEQEAIIANIAVNSSTIDYRVIIEAACINNPGELLAVKNAYQALYKRSLEEDVAAHSSGDLRKFLLPLGGSGVDEDALTRVVITRAEMDLREIKEISKDYKSFLLALVGN